MRTLLALDLDGTLLNGMSELSPYAVSVLTRCRERGFVIAFATARPKHACRRFTALFVPEVMIASGGAVAERDGEILYAAAMQPDRLRALQLQVRRLRSLRYQTFEPVAGGYCADRPVDEQSPAGGSMPRSPCSRRAGCRRGPCINAPCACPTRRRPAR